MTRHSILSILALVLFCLSCGNPPERPDPILDQNYQPAPAGAATTNTTTNEPPQNAQGVWHYTCPNGCAGGAGSATPCANCGTTLVHNTEYHNNSGSTPNVTTSTINPATGTPTPGITLGNGSSIQPVNSSGVPGAPPAPKPKAPEPAQNASGVWHYTCPSGCDGGAGSAVACANCGTTLTHNQLYHQ